MTPATIRSARPDDCAAIARIMRASLDGLGFVPTLHTAGENAAFIAGLLLGSDVHIAEAGGAPVGFVAIARDDLVPALYVLPAWQARGIGPALLTAARAGRRRLVLRCFQQNTVARRFYERHGFRPVAFDDVGRNDEGLPDVTYAWEETMTDWSKGAAWMKGDIIPVGEAAIGVTDWGVTRSDITYDVAAVVNGGFFRLDDYIARFVASMAALRMEVGMDAAAIRAACHAIVARSGLRDAYVAMVAARGVPLVFGTRDPRACANHFYAWCVPYIHVIRPEIAEAGASVWIARDVRRIPEDSVNPRAKNYHWGDFTQGLFEAKDRGFETVLLLDHQGNVTEGPGFNAFALKGDTVVTSRHGVLHGITRRTVLEMCAEIGLATEQRPLPLDEFLEADEIWLSTTGGGVVPVTRVDDRIFSNGAPGPAATRLRALYRDWTARPALRQEVAYAA